MAFQEILQHVYFGNTVAEYILAVSAFHVCLILLKIFKQLIHIKLKKFSDRTENCFDDVLVKSIDFHWPFYVVISLYLGIWFIRVPEFIDKAVYYMLLLILTFYGARVIQHLISYVVHKLIAEKGMDNEDSAMIDLVGKFAKIIVWILVVLFLMSNFGYNISTLLAGLGIGGIAIAFALQNILGDIFASFSIYFDRPFQIGDFIVVGQDMGVVQKIGIKSTRIKTLRGEQLIISNKELTESRVNNYKHMEKRRSLFNIGVTYQTKTKIIKEIPNLIKKIIEKTEMAEFDRAHFKNYGDSSLIFEIVYYINSPAYDVYMDVQQKINIAIKETFDKKKIEFAYPTQTLFVKKTR